MAFKNPLKRGIIILILSTFLFLLVWYFLPLFSSPNQPQYTNRMPEVFGSSHARLFQDHHQMLDFIADIKSQGKLNDTPKILINFDLHSDIYPSAISKTHNGNWLNTLLTQKNTKGDNFIDEVYWVLPEETNTAPQKDYYWNTEESTTPDKILLDGPDDYVFYEDSNGNIVSDGETPPPSSRIIKFHKRLLSQLPSFNSSPAQIILSIDADYFIYDGLFTSSNFYPNKFTKIEIENNLKNTVDTLYRLGIKPILVGISQSPEFTLDALEPTINNFYLDLAKYSK